MDSPKYAKFDISEVTYKVVNGQDIKTYILTPKDISPGPHPVVAKFHGGFFVTGDALYPDWYPQWALDYCLLHSAIIVTPNYRLLPESTGMDMYSDILSFWDWVRTDLQPHLDITRHGITADLDKVLIHGESAGGTIAMLSGFSQPKGFIKAVVAMYSPLGQQSKHKRTKPIMGAPTFPPAIIESHLASMVPGRIVTSGMPPERTPLAISAVQQGKLELWYGDDKKLDLFQILEDVQVGDMVYTLILHGEEDSAVPVQGTLDWAERLTAKVGEEKVGDGFNLHIEKGAEHGFDAAVPLETDWLQEKLAKVTEKWLSGKAQAEK